MKSSTVKKLNHIPLLCMFIGVFIIGTLIFILSFKILNHKTPEYYEPVEAKIVEFVPETTIMGDDITETYKTIIEYTYDKVYRGEYGQYNSFMELDDIVTIYVDPTNPSVFEPENANDPMFTIISGVFVVIGVVGIIYNAKKLKEVKERESVE